MTKQSPGPLIDQSKPTQHRVPVDQRWPEGKTPIAPNDYNPKVNRDPYGSSGLPGLKDK